MCLALVIVVEQIREKNVKCDAGSLELWFHQARLLRSKHVRSWYCTDVSVSYAGDGEKVLETLRLCNRRLLMTYSCVSYDLRLAVF